MNLHGHRAYALGIIQGEHFRLALELGHHLFRRTLGEFALLLADKASRSFDGLLPGARAVHAVIVFDLGFLAA